MGVSSNKAFAGVFHNGTQAVEVFYADKHTLARWNRGRTRNHPDNWKAGWYWVARPEQPKHPAQGPYTSSEKAYKHAMAWPSQPMDIRKARGPAQRIAA